MYKRQAWLGLAVSLAINLSGAYRKPILEPSHYGYNKGALAPVNEGFYDGSPSCLLYTSRCV